MQRGGNIVLPLVILAGGSAAMYVAITNPEGGGFAGLGRLLRGEDVGSRNTGFSAAAASLATVAGNSRGGGRPGSGTAPTNYPTGGAGGSVSGKRAKVLAVSKTWLGVPYRWGGESREGVDCSGLTLRVYAAVGVTLMRISAAQQTMGVARSADTAKPGDLVFFGLPAHHVGIYLGNGMIRHAPRTGTVVRDERIWGGEVVTYRDVLTGQKRDNKRLSRKRTIST